MKEKGVVYTPEYWANWAVETFNIAEKWMSGKTILDPGSGEGALVSAVIKNAYKRGYVPSAADFSRLYCMDRDSEAMDTLVERVTELSGSPLPGINTRVGDYLLEPPGIKADIVFSNPPWVSFGDLDETDKESYKPIFRSSGLTPKPKSLLLGGSRIDLSALFTVIALNRDTAENGEGYFFLPISLFRSEAAHSAFRQLSLPSGRSFALKGVWDMNGGEPFPGAGTGYCLASYRADETQQWPIRWLNAEPGEKWKEMEADPADGPGTPLLPRPAGSPRIKPPRIHVPAGTVPRQGVNCQGASGVFHIREIGEEQNGRLPVISKNGYSGFLPPQLVFPMMSASSFSTEENPIPDRWIFMPYKLNGKVMNPEELSAFPDALEWVERHKNILENRRGMMLKKPFEKGIYWPLIGVGAYSFAPWKLAWESFGRKRFVPMLFSSNSGLHWQGNQALHAFLPFIDEYSARKALKNFLSPDLEIYLKLLGGAGTKNWAQPGRIRRLLEHNSQQELFSTEIHQTERRTSC